MLRTPTRLLVLPSREDGFGVVVAQALSCGLPVLCSDRTGGPDLKLNSGLAGRIHVVPAGQGPALARGISRLADLVLSPGGLPPLAAEERQALSLEATWSAT